MTTPGEDADPRSREALSADLRDQMGGGFSSIPVRYAVRMFVGPGIVVLGALVLASVLVPSEPAATSTVVAGLVIGLAIMSIGMAALWTPMVWHTRRFLRLVRTVRALRRARRRPL